jgi:hypothetical protein
VKWPCAFNGLMGIAISLLPLTAVPESRVRTGAANAPLSATAHLNFKIVIPKVLYLQVGNGNDRILDAQTVAILSNGHNVSLNATVRSADAGISLRSADAVARSNVILNSAARKGIAQDARCRPGGPASRPVICTVSTP